MKSIKKILLSIFFVAAAISTNAQTQKRELSVLGNLGFQTDFKRFGIGAQARYNIMNNIRIAPDVTFFFPKDKVTGFDINVNAHYVFDLKKERFSFYPLAGIGMQNNHYGKQTINVNGKEEKTDSRSTTDFAFNLGAGATYNLDLRSYLNFEGKYMFGSKHCAVFLIGYGYKF